MNSDLINLAKNSSKEKEETGKIMNNHKTRWKA